MQHIQIDIGRQNDPKPIDPPTGIVKADFVGESYCLQVCLLEGGTTKGNASLTFVIKLLDGKATIFQMTENIFDGIVSALSGAKQHWIENPVESIYK